jgi:succinyl-CoA synthetase beta subunit
MKIHEYQGKEILRTLVRYAAVFLQVNGAEAEAAQSSAARWVAAQIHAGGRGKGGGVKVAKTRMSSASPVRSPREETHQTGPEGQRSAACTSEDLR